MLAPSISNTVRVANQKLFVSREEFQETLQSLRGRTTDFDGIAFSAFLGNPLASNLLRLIFLHQEPSKTDWIAFEKWWGKIANEVILVVHSLALFFHVYDELWKQVAINLTGITAEAILFKVTTLINILRKIKNSIQRR